MLLEAFAYIADLLLFYLDRQANETYLPTALERQNIINMCKLIGYVPKISNPAQIDIIVSIDRAHSTSVTLPAKSLLETNDGIFFETQSDAVIPPGELSVTVKALEGETFNEIVGSSDGEVWQEFYLPRSSGMVRQAKSLQRVIALQYVTESAVAWLAMLLLTQ